MSQPDRSEQPKEEEEGDLLGFGLFDELFEQMEFEEHQEAMKKKCSKKAIESLCEHIGGFHLWPQLIDDCKEAVAKFLDRKTLTKLGMCSKADAQLVMKIPIHVHSIAITDTDSRRYDYANDEFDNVSVRVQFNKDYNSGQWFEWLFSQMEKDTQVRWMKYSARRHRCRCRIIENSNYYEEAVKYAEGWMKRCQFKLNGITVEMSKYPIEKSKIKALPNCTDVRFGADDLDTFRWWFDKIPEQLDSLQLVTCQQDRDTFVFPKEFLALPQVMNTKDFYFWARAAFSDEQFLNLKAKRISFDAVDLTDDGINAFLKKWAKGKVVDDFKRVLLWSPRVPEKQRVMRGLQVRQWDEAFEDEARGFCDDYSRVCGRGDPYQISSNVEPFDSLTVSFSDDRISIYATGKKYTYNGETYTSYGIP